MQLSAKSREPRTPILGLLSTGTFSGQTYSQKQNSLKLRSFQNSLIIENKRASSHSIPTKLSEDIRKIIITWPATLSIARIIRRAQFRSLHHQLAESFTKDTVAVRGNSAGAMLKLVLLAYYWRHFSSRKIGTAFVVAAERLPTVPVLTDDVCTDTGHFDIDSLSQLTSIFVKMAWLRCSHLLMELGLVDLAAVVSEWTKMNRQNCWPVASFMHKLHGEIFRQERLPNYWSWLAASWVITLAFHETVKQVSPNLLNSSLDQHHKTRW